MTTPALIHWFIEPPLWLGVIVAALFAAGACAAGWLSRSGAVAAFLIGFIVFGLGGGFFLIALLAFFISSSVLSHVGRARKRAQAAVTEKGATRDASQVLANGAVAAALVIVFKIFVTRWPVADSRYLLLLFLAALATVNADTWATEIGGLSGARPRLLTNWRPAAPGTSGAISALGTVAALAGSLVVPLSVAAFWHLDLAELVVVAWAGFLGSIIDSLLGAGVQAAYRDRDTGAVTDRRASERGPNKLVHGVAWINNDVVNFAAGVGGVICAWVMLRYGLNPYR